MPGEIFTIRQVADYLQMSSSTIYLLANRGGLPGRKIGGGWRFLKSEIDEWIAGNQRRTHLDILVVEDEEHVRRLFVDALTPKGHRIDTAADGEAAFDLIHEKTYDLVFLDLALPGANGIDVYKAISHMPQAPEVIVITTFSSSHLLTKALEHGLLTVIQKPFRLETIFEAIEKASKEKSTALRSESR